MTVTFVQPAELQTGDRFVSKDGYLHYTVTDPPEIADGLVIALIEWSDGGFGSRVWLTTDDVNLRIERN